MDTIDKTKPVLVTGATGYVAGWIVKKLLKEGLTVHAPVRDPENKEKLMHLNKIANDNPGTIKYFKADLLVNDSYKEAMEGCELVFHTASPFILKVKDAQKQLVDPALKGTINVLTSVNACGSVKRVVLTSSVVAIFGDAIDTQKLPNGVLTEKEWNSTSTLKHQPYNYSKLLAEKKAWEMMEQQNRWDMTVINPGFVMGPAINPNAKSESISFFKQLIDGSSKMGVPSLEFGIVDVRDLAEAHFNAGSIESAKGRHILCAGTLTMLGIANIIREKAGDKYPLPKKELPKFMLYLFAPLVGITYKFIKNNVGWPVKFDNSKSKKELNVNYRPLQETIIDLFEQIK
jgi:dihydroflavonol-4-reductase